VAAEEIIYKKPARRTNNKATKCYFVYFLLLVKGLRPLGQRAFVIGFALNI
jgi:hypothetical protein